MREYTAPEYEELENTTARVIFYSCIDKPRTVTQISEIWEYTSANYFYQRRQKKLIEKLEQIGFVSTSSSFIDLARPIDRASDLDIRTRGFIKSNYNFVLRNDAIKSLFDSINNDLSIDFIQDEYDYKISRELLEKDEFRKFALEQKPELKNKLEKLLFNASQIKRFITLWEDPIFIELFLSADNIKMLFDDRRKLPVDPLVFLYDLVVAICEDYYDEKGRNKDNFFGWQLYKDFFYIEDESYIIMKNYIIIHQDDNLDRLKNMASKLYYIYEILKEKVRIYGEEEIERRPNKKEFIDWIEYLI